MADIHVTTVDGLKTALQTSGANVFLDNDLDFNSVSMGSSAWCTIIASDFDGQGHTLYNIQSGNSGVIFKNGTYSNTVFKIHNANFYNVLLLGSGYLFDGTSSTYHNMKIEECKIQGKASRLFGAYMSIGGVTKCNFKINGDCRISDTDFSLCYFDFDTPSSNFYTGTYLSATDCYFKGHVKLSSGSFTSSSFARNVWNVYNDNATTPTMQGSPNLYNSDRATFSGGIGLTDSQLKDRDYIANNTTFPIL